MTNNTGQIDKRPHELRWTQIGEEWSNIDDAHLAENVAKISASGIYVIWGHRSKLTLPGGRLVDGSVCLCVNHGKISERLAKCLSRTTLAREMIHLKWAEAPYREQEGMVRCIAAALKPQVHRHVPRSRHEKIVTVNLPEIPSS